MSTATMPLYEEILFEDLALPRDFIERQQPAIGQRLREAAAESLVPSGELDALNTCYSLASSLVLRQARKLNGTLEKLRRTPEFADRDPTAIVTVAALYYLLRHESEQSTRSEDKESLDRVRRRFSDMHWRLAPNTVKSLGIEHLNGKRSLVGNLS